MGEKVLRLAICAILVVVVIFSDVFLFWKSDCQASSSNQWAQHGNS